MRLDTSTTELRAVTELLAVALARVPREILRKGIVAAVSAGADSSALALGLHSLQRTALWPDAPAFVIAHVDHGVRPDSADDATAARRLAAALGVRHVERRLPPFATARPGEAELRDARYRALLEVAGELGAGAVATAHHADDVIETCVFRAMRGTGLRGLAAIPAIRPLSDNVALLRPLLTARRCQLAAACDAVGWQPRIDPSNADLRRARNHLRHAVLPAWRAEHGAALFDTTILACVDAARRAVEAHDGAVATFYANAARRRGEGLHLTCSPSSPERAIVAGALRLAHLELRAAAPSSHWLTRAVGLLDAATGRALAGRGATLRVTRTRSGLVVGDVEAARRDAATIMSRASASTHPGDGPSVATERPARHTLHRAASDPPAAHEVP